MLPAFSLPPRVQEQCQRYAPEAEPVLILGEPGTGKTLAARYMHDLSRPLGPFHRMSLPYLSPGLEAGELRGHEKGAFTNALSTHHGWFEVSNMGTLFLDELADARMATQEILLQLLDEGGITRLGGERFIPLDVRIIAGTNGDLGAKIAGGSFRQDLRDRFGFLEIVMPPLRERRGEILGIARAFLDRKSAARRLTRRITLSPDAATILQNAPWPGNIRELRNALTFAMIWAHSSHEIAPEHLPEAIGGGMCHASARRRPASALTYAELTEVLASAGGSKRDAARVLRIDESYFHRLLKRARSAQDRPGPSGHTSEYDMSEERPRPAAAIY